MPVDETKTLDIPEFNRHPLKEFWGLIMDINEVVEHNKNTNKDNSFIVFDIAQVEVIEANEPFVAPVTQIRVMELNFPKTDFAVLKDSIVRCGISRGESLNTIIGKRTHWKWAPATLNRRVTEKDESGEDVTAYRDTEANCWQILEIDGISNTTNLLIDKTVEHADGKDASSFKASFLSDLTLQQLSNYDIVAQNVMNNTQLDQLVTVGKLTVDEAGLYHKVG